MSNTCVPCTNTVESYDTTFPLTLVYSWIKFTSGKFAKKVLMIKDLVKDAQFKPVCLRGCTVDRMNEYITNHVECPGFLAK